MSWLTFTAYSVRQHAGYFHIKVIFNEISAMSTFTYLVGSK